ncbi:MAG: AGE family epimerase/isomerase [Kiritimatiellae bacterium]|nr:AGE family epimerase/isomerase [Kiritimatiellia bacterium]
MRRRIPLRRVYRTEPIMQFKGTLIETPTPAAIRSVCTDYEVMLVTILDAVMARYEQDPDYRFIDTKLSLLTGADFATPADPARDFRSKDAVFGWIQGRGLEALVGHARWLDSCTVLSQREKDDRQARLRTMTRAIFENLETIRARNDGHLSFLMTRDGAPFTMDDSGKRRTLDLAGAPNRLTDVFYVKGMLAAADFLGDRDKLGQAKDCLRAVLADIGTDRFGSDQVSFDPKNRVRPVPGRKGHGPRMLAIGACALFYETTGEQEWLEFGEVFIRYVLEKHVNRGRFPDLEPHDFFEAIDEDGQPWQDERGILCDPGHALEFLGLAVKLLLQIDRKESPTPSQQTLLDECRTLFPEVFVQSFENGFNRPIGGICKAFDLLSRKPINTDMPWWSLPETLRTCAEMLVLWPEMKHRDKILEALMLCSNAFFKNFVNRDVHLMAYQTVDANGKPVDVVPATPDADPGYHTGLSIIDFLGCVRHE